MLNLAALTGEKNSVLGREILGRFSKKVLIISNFSLWFTRFSIFFVSTFISGSTFSHELKLYFSRFSEIGSPCITCSGFSVFLVSIVLGSFLIGTAYCSVMRGFKGILFFSSGFLSMSVFSTGVIGLIGGMSNFSSFFSMEGSGDAFFMGDNVGSVFFIWGLFSTGFCSVAETGFSGAAAFESLVSDSFRIKVSV